MDACDPHIVQTDNAAAQHLGSHGRLLGNGQIARARAGNAHVGVAVRLGQTAHDAETRRLTIFEHVSIARRQKRLDLKSFFRIEARDQHARLPRIAQRGHDASNLIGSFSFAVNHLGNTGALLALRVRLGIAQVYVSFWHVDHLYTFY